jgi:hypothetical protein
MMKVYRVVRTVPVYHTSPPLEIEALNEEDAEAIAMAIVARNEWPEEVQRVRGEPRFEITEGGIPQDQAISALKTLLNALPTELTEKRAALRMAIEAMRAKAPERLESPSVHIWNTRNLSNNQRPQR